ncbi:hypothetical protein SAMN04488065_2352 [Haloplanus vescus]|uniref:Uncharacterized protein n=1 Tax=Haloplanus vescus TaxID=555874 RepID=A0A1H3ZGM1_9EURY|nr:hypothetical protein [Haloplanus vescus]SEA22795.1 hypothetical protein SAMN04488065_2352 [Haloplanus vescus]
MSYQPAQCNIGRRQRFQRAAYAAVAVLVAVGMVVAYLLDAFPRLLLVGVFAPLALAFEFALQAYESFCVSLALLGKYDFSGESGGTKGTVSDPADHHDDQLYALRITVVSVALAAVVTVGLVAVV